jgi:hypothetical protein
VGADPRNPSFSWSAFNFKGMNTESELKGCDHTFCLSARDETDFQRVVSAPIYTSNERMGLF